MRRRVPLLCKSIVHHLNEKTFEENWKSLRRLYFICSTCGQMIADDKQLLKSRSQMMVHLIDSRDIERLFRRKCHFKGVESRVPYGGSSEGSSHMPTIILTICSNRTETTVSVVIGALMTLSLRERSLRAMRPLFLFPIEECRTVMLDTGGTVLGSCTFIDWK